MTDELYHYGILGQKWGIRRFQNLDGSYTAEGKKRYGSEGFGGVYDKPDGTKDLKRMNKDAKKDAEEMARANAYYGEGAGTRRKIVKNRISERMKDEDYKKLYDKYYAEQDMSKRQKEATRERHVTDAKDKTISTIKKTAKIIAAAGGTLVTVAVLAYNLGYGNDIKKIIDKVKNFKWKR